MLKVSLQYLKDDKPAVRDAGCIAIGAAIGRSKDPTGARRSAENGFLSVMGNSKESLETHQAVAKGLCLALQLAHSDDNVEYFGIPLINACLKLAMSGTQRVQYAFNDVLYLALHVADGQGGLDPLLLAGDVRRLETDEEPILEGAHENEKDQCLG